MKITCLLSLCCLLAGQQGLAQTITGAWKGKIGPVQTEIKLIKKGDSLVGTSYYYTSKNNYRRYAVRGYFDGQTNNVIWWDEALLEDKASGKGGNDRTALLAIADFNCPGEDKMLLEGESTDRDNKHKKKGTVSLQKTASVHFRDDWDFVIDNYLVGANDPYIIDSIAGRQLAPPPPDPETSLATTTIQPPITETTPDIHIPEPAPAAVTSPSSDIEKKFAGRKKILSTVIPVSGDSIEIRFYDNAVVDGDSISVFLNNRLMFEHVRLNYKPYTLKVAVDDLQDDNELVMVAENLGTIPPNTSLMVVVIGDKRYETRLQSTEDSSALIRFIKQK